jgi:hypothetical protein
LKFFDWLYAHDNEVAEKQSQQIKTELAMPEQNRAYRVSWILPSAQSRIYATRLLALAAIFAVALANQFREVLCEAVEGTIGGLQQGRKNGIPGAMDPRVSL